MELSLCFGPHATSPRRRILDCPQTRHNRPHFLRCHSLPRAKAKSTPAKTAFSSTTSLRGLLFMSSTIGPRCDRCEDRHTSCDTEAKITTCSMGCIQSSTVSIMRMRCSTWMEVGGHERGNMAVWLSMDTWFFEDFPSRQMKRSRRILRSSWLHPIVVQIGIISKT